MPHLYVFSGLPGVGKTTIATLVAQELGGTYLRVDSVETALIRAGISEESMGGKGYAVCYAIARDNLKMGMPVVADMVNPIGITREEWQAVADSTQSDLLNIEVVCSDAAEHRRRIEERQQDIPGHRLPTWDEVRNREYEQWTKPSLRIDTANTDPFEALKRVKALRQSP